MGLEAYVNYVESPENGLRQEKKIDKMAYMLQYKPLEYIAIREFRSTDIQGSDIKKRIEKMSDLQCFNLRVMAADKQSDVGRLGSNSDQEFTQRNTYMSFDMQNDIYLLDGDDTLPCGLFQYVNNYGLAPYADFVLAFANNDMQKNEDKTFVYEDKLFGGGIVKFQIRKEDIENTPMLKIN